MDKLGRWKMLRSKSLLKNKWLEVKENDYKLPDNSIFQGYYVVHERNGVNVIALTKDDDVLVLKQ